MLTKFKKAIMYFFWSFSNLKGLSDAVNKADSPEDLDNIVLGGRS